MLRVWVWCEQDAVAASSGAPVSRRRVDGMSELLSSPWSIVVLQRMTHDDSSCFVHTGNYRARIRCISLLARLISTCWTRCSAASVYIANAQMSALRRRGFTGQSLEP